MTKSHKQSKEVRNSLNFEKPEGKSKWQPSKTIPDQTLSMKEIITRFRQGLPLSSNNATPIYEGNDGSPVDFEALDLTDQMDMIEQAIKERDEILNKWNQEQREKKKHLEKLQLRKELEAEQRQLDLEEEINKSETRKKIIAQGKIPPVE